MKPLKIAHRGASGHAPENTLLAFQKAVLMNCHGVELDVRLSKDEKVMVFHDETTERLTNSTGHLRDLTFDSLAKLRVGGQKIPDLAQVINMLPTEMLINIEIKCPDALRPTLKIIERHIKGNQSAKRFLVSSFDWNSLSELRELNDKIPIGVLTHTDIDLAASFSGFINAESIHPNFHLLNAENCRRLQEKNLKVFAWTVNEPDDVALVKSLGVDAIITDYPDRI